MKKGDKVTVVMDANNRFPWQYAPSWKAIWKRSPQGEGDTATLVVDQEHYVDGGDYLGTEVELNLSSSSFVGVYRLGQ